MGVNEISSLDNTAVNRRAETEGTVMSECEGNNSDSIVTTEVCQLGSCKSY